MYVYKAMSCGRPNNRTGMYQLIYICKCAVCRTGTQIQMSVRRERETGAICDEDAYVDL